MIDIHSHVLPQMDDGSQSVDESRQLLELLRRQGVQALGVTSHFYGTQDTPEHFLERRAKALSSLPETDMTLIPGAEVAYFDGMSHCQALTGLQLGDSGLILIEMPFGKWTERMLHELCQLPLQVGLTPVLAHVERYRRRDQLPKYQQELLNQGVLFQCNAEAFLHLRDRRWALGMLRQGQVHFLGSDTHNLTVRVSKLDQAAQVITRKMGAEALTELTAFSKERLKL